MQLYCYRCLWSAYFVSLMKYSMWKFLPEFFCCFTEGERRKSIQHAISNFASKQFSALQKAHQYDNGMWSFPRKTIPRIKSEHRKKFFFLNGKKREKQLIIFRFCCTLFGPLFLQRAFKLNNFREGEEIMVKKHN